MCVGKAYTHFNSVSDDRYLLLYICVTLSISFSFVFFLCMMKVLHGASVCPSASEHDALK